MTPQKIWHVSEGRRFPLDLRSSGLLDIKLEEIPSSALVGVKPEPGTFHVFLIQGERGGLPAIRNLIDSTPHLLDYPRIIILTQDDYKIYNHEAEGQNVLVLDDTVRPGHLKLILELVLKIEYYRQVVFRLSSDLSEQSNLFENLLKLARAELDNVKAESRAYEALVAFENSHRRFQSTVQEAMDRTLRLKDQEMLSLKTTLGAYERLGEYRDKELTDVKRQIDATESALNLSRKENIDREKVIEALVKLRAYTDGELIELYNENQSLRGKLGMPPRD